MDTTEGVAEVRRERERCPYCHDEVGADLPRLACNACTAWHHEDCWVEGGGSCSACGESRTGLGAAPQPAAKARRTYPPTPEPTGLTYYLGLPLDFVMAHSQRIGVGLLALLLLIGIGQALYLWGTGRL